MIKTSLTTQKVAELTGLPVRAIRYHITAGHLPAEKVRVERPNGGRGGYLQWAIRPEDAQEFKAKLEAGQIGTRGGNYGGGRPRKAERKPEARIYVPLSPEEKEVVLEMSPEQRREVLVAAGKIGKGD